MAHTKSVSVAHIQPAFRPEFTRAIIRRPIRIPAFAPEFYPGYDYAYSQPSFYGTCSAVSGVGIVSNNCVPNSMPVATSGNGCYCYDPYTQWAGCGNTANGVCRLPIAQPYPVIRPIPVYPAPYPPQRCPPGLLC